MSKLTLLGAWDTVPIFAWPWHSDKAVRHFKRLTGFRFRPFTYLKDGLHYQYFFAAEINRLQKYFDGLQDKQKLQFTKRICNDYYVQAKKISTLLKKLERKNYRSLTDSQLAMIVHELHEALPLVTMQVWFVVLLDIWYPCLNDLLKVKKAGLGARDHCGHLYEQIRDSLKKIFKEIERRKKVSQEDIYCLFPEEIISVLRNNDIPCSKLKMRKKLYLTTITAGKYHIYEGQKAKILLKKYLPLCKARSAKILKGQPACSGKVQGRVRKILLDSEFKRFKKGEILVALQTMVKFVPIMKKSRAILTEFGGITSHAAVVSRELNKPCIVSIDNLTASLKDGDKIEVDAEKGVVKIL